jgi:hypothetical protein
VISAKEVRVMLDTGRDQEREWRDRPPLEVDLSDYDALLDKGEEEERWVDAVENSFLMEVKV